MRVARAWLIAVAAVALIGAGPARVKSVGTISAVDGATRTITITEVGPLAPSREPLALIRVTLDDDTAVFSVTRDTLGVAEWPGGFLDSTIPATSLAVGDYVIAESERLGGRLLVRRLTVIVSPAR